jgi:hypothetical protein
MQMRALTLAIALVLVIAAHARHAAAEAVDLELMLAVDISGSIDRTEARLQREGYLKALAHPSVIAAITSGKHRRVAIAYMEWGGPLWQYTLVDWTVVRDAASARAFAGNIATFPIHTVAWTSISNAIDHAVEAFAKNPHKGARRVLDISGDGRHNKGGALMPARARALALGITINGLPIMNNRPNAYGQPIDKNLDEYYRTRVIGGRGAFIIVAKGFNAFAEAVRAKLVREIAGRGGPAAQRAAHR